MWRVVYRTHEHTWRMRNEFKAKQQIAFVLRKQKAALLKAQSQRKRQRRKPKPMPSQLWAFITSQLLIGNNNNSSNRSNNNETRRVFCMQVEMQLKVKLN